MDTKIELIQPLSSDCLLDPSTETIDMNSPDASIDQTSKAKKVSDMTEPVQKIYPSESELTSINNFLLCPVGNCGNNTFTSESNLKLHLTKTHKKTNLMQTDKVIKQYHCPDIKCVYFENQYFKNKKLLKQHYMKTHTPKTWMCQLCDKGFPTENYRKLHSEYCGVTFKCSSCDSSYLSYETLKTHGRRKNHTIKEKFSFRSGRPNRKQIMIISKSDTNLNTMSSPMILPKPSASLQVLFMPMNASPFDTNDRSIQTEGVIPKLKSKLTQVHRNPLILKQNTQHTQTLGPQKPQLTVETQTIGDYFKRKPINLAASDESEDINRKSIKTQTKSVSSKSTSCNTSFNMVDFDFSMSAEVQRSSSGTQTMVQSNNHLLYASTTNTHDSTHTDTSDLLVDNISEHLEHFDSSFFNCNMETQTDLIFNDEIFDYCDYYNNTYTQTCEDMWLNGLGFNNIETQTVDEMLRSVESQTMMSHNKKTPFSCRDISHMETQTDMEFKQMLEEINA